MTFVGVRIENGEFEVGFRASSYREYQDHLRVVYAAAGLLWPVQNAEPDLSRDPAEPPQSGDFADAREGESVQDVRDRYQVQRREQAWRERQGLVGADDGAVA